MALYPRSRQRRILARGGRGPPHLACARHRRFSLHTYRQQPRENLNFCTNSPSAKPYPYPRLPVIGTFRPQPPPACPPARAGGQHAPPLRLPERQPRADPLPPQEGRGHRQQAGPAVLERLREPEAQAGQDHAAGGQERGVGDTAAEGGGRGQRRRRAGPPGKALKKAAWRLQL